MKYFIKKHFSFIMFGICLSIVLIHIANGIYENVVVKNKQEKIIAYINRYEYFNIVNPSEENLEKLNNLENILPIDSKTKEYKSFFLEFFKENLNLDKITCIKEKIIYFLEDNEI